MTAANPGKENALDFPIATVLIVALIILGAVDVIIDGSLSKDYKQYIDTIALPLAGLALGRGWAARKPG